MTIILVDPSLMHYQHTQDLNKGFLLCQGGSAELCKTILIMSVRLQKNCQSILDKIKLIQVGKERHLVIRVQKDLPYIIHADNP